MESVTAHKNQTLYVVVMFLIRFYLQFFSCNIYQLAYENSHRLPDFLLNRKFPPTEFSGFTLGRYVMELALWYILIC